MSFFEPILAAMLFLQAPGKSIYSQVVVPEHSPRPCDNSYHLLCAPPHYSTHHDGWTVAESYEQGLVRYADIARAADRVIARSRWETDRPTLYRLLLTAVQHESGFRRDIHSGIGPAGEARGDCRWRKVKRGGREIKVAVPGSCRSVCLIQRMLPRGQKTAEGWSREDLMGLDARSTERCLTVGVRILDNAFSWCSKRGPRPLIGCVFQQYGGGGVRMDDGRIRARIGTYRKLRNAPVVIDGQTKQLLQTLSESRRQIAGTTSLQRRTNP